MIEERIERKRPRGRPRIEIINDLLLLNSNVKMKRKVENRDAWRYRLPRT